MRLVIIEAGHPGEESAAYVRACMADCVNRGEIPLIASNYAAGNPREVADLTAAYIDFGISDWMRVGIAQAEADGRRVEYRSLYSGLAGGHVEAPTPSKPLTATPAPDTVHV
jgi:hypothetical protein